MMNNLHCGACMKPMASCDELNEHLLECKAAKALLYPATMLMFGAEDKGHDTSHLIYAAHKYTSLINEYARAVATDMNSFRRSEIHARLCDRLGLEYSEFRPFESEKIKEIPTVTEAEGIIWEAIGDILRSRLVSV